MAESVNRADSEVSQDEMTPSNASPPIEVRGFGKSYRGTDAVESLSFEVQGGQILGLLGPNGAGKTTTLRALAGILPPSAGQIAVCGFDMVRQPIDAKRCLAFIPDDPRLFETLTVWEHLEFIAASYGVTDFEVRAEELLREASLIEKRNALAQELSRGMKQKLAIACAYLHEPKVLLFDEPLTGLDPHSIERLKRSMVEQAQAGAAVVISSHLLPLIEDQCTHVLILDRGVCRYKGAVDDVQVLAEQADQGSQLQRLFFKLTCENQDE